MEKIRDPKQKTEENTQLLSGFIQELNITRRKLQTYPAGHPIIETAYEKLQNLLAPVFREYPKFAFGVSRGALLFEHKWLDRNNPRTRDFASVLSNLDIAAIHFHSQPEKDEFLRLVDLFNFDQQKIRTEGDLETILKRLDFSSIEVTPIDYSLFRAIDLECSEEELDEKLWEDFISRLLSNSPTEQIASDISELDPKKIAEILNRNYAISPGDEKDNYHRDISRFIRQLITAKAEKSSTQFASLLVHLDPQLRQQFVSSVFQQLDKDQTVSEEDLQVLPPSLIELALQKLQSDQEKVSDTMINLVGSLHRHHQRKGQVTSGDITVNENIGEHLRSLFQEEDKGKFTPISYQNTLDVVVRQAQPFNLPKEEKEDLLRQVMSSSTERHNCAIVFNLLGTHDLHAESSQKLQENLIDIADYFLATGDFKGLNYIIQRLKQHLHRHPGREEYIATLQYYLNSPEFYQEVLDNINRWDEHKQKEINAFIKAAGAGFAGALIERLSTEEDKTLRRTFLNTLAGFGKAAHPVIYQQLHDDRWYVIRNMLTILRMQNDPIDLKELRHLEKLPHQRVNQEYLQLLFKFDRPRAADLLGKQLRSKDSQLKIHAVQLAGQSNDPATSKLLLKMLHGESLTDDNLQLQLQLVRSLCTLAVKEALPTLNNLLKSGFFYTPKRKIELQKEIVRNLNNYPAQSVKPILQKLANSRRKHLNSLAAEKLRQLLRKQQ